MRLIISSINNKMSEHHQNGPITILPVNNTKILNVQREAIKLLTFENLKTVIMKKFSLLKT